MEYIKLGELSEFIMGQAPNSQYCNKKGKGTPFVKAGQFGVKYPIIDEWTTKSLKKALKKDVLICVVGATAGKINLGCDCSIGRSVSAIRCNEKKLDHVYLYYYLKTWITKIRQQSQGSAVGVITKEMLNDIIIPVVTLSEQNRIVTILDKAQFLINKRKTQIEALDELVKSRFIEMFGDPVKNPMKLPKTPLSNIGQWKTGGTPSRSNSEYYNGNIPWLSSGELNNIYCFNSDEMITELAIKESSAKIIEKGSLLLGMYDTAALKSTINMIECSCNQAIAYAKLDENLVNTIYVYYCIQIGKDFYKSQQRGVRQKNLNLSMVKELEILMPELKLQNQFADFVNQGNTLKFEMEKSLKELEDNFNSLMQRAFKGELFN
ncbi:restriction endonuclease subunit S [Clostridium botulinum]|uniref:Restriction modification system DNA specificity domain-containing protein n=1 Tax=Clostridium botulinum CFSAN001627 TaxID=1232189 RepID=M1ZV00_CLOBO|nr:restriction endonuclease subunit S [Clostridium botulinum]EKN40470.1 restriction modification system DNA specificity domain-containing protein [Clostridium botulinum CFSAN001627]APC80738.1 type I restriction modification DNA specificity domain protein [Clostridium botulinum]APC84500.1 type I restriction modification DNA specificity domain protein [Clostridium botulinum]AXG95955.1 restriction endonuclease subunit S [Clostridium botulinum]EDT83404.1 type I restriction-modification system spec